MDAAWLRKFTLIAQAEMPTRKYVQSISGATQKAVLWTLFAHEGSPMSFQAIADRSGCSIGTAWRTVRLLVRMGVAVEHRTGARKDRKSTRLNSSHVKISYAVFCLKKKNGLAGTAGRCGH